MISFRILVGGQGDCGEKTRVHVVKQFVPIPYYVPKPIYKYIMRHHYVPVRQVVVKPVPVPYPVNYGHGYSSGSYGGHGGGGESGYGGDSGYSSGGGEGGSSGPYSDSGDYDSDYDSESSRPNQAQFYSSPPESTPAYGKYSSGYNSGDRTSSTSAYKRTSYETSPTYSTSTSSVGVKSTTTMSPVTSGLKASPSDNYFYQSSKPYSIAYDDYSRNGASNTNSANYQLYSPVYSAPNGELYSTGQVYADTRYLNATNGATVLPSYIPSSALSTVTMGHSEESTSTVSTPTYDSNIRNSLSARSSTSGTGYSKAYGKKLFKAEIKRAKLLSKQFTKRTNT